MTARTISEAKVMYWRRLAAEATTGPWTDGSDCVLAGGVTAVLWTSSGGADEPICLHYRSAADREFIYAAREAVPALIAERDHLIARLRELGVALAPSRDEQDEAEWQIAQRER